MRLSPARWAPTSGRKYIPSPGFLKGPAHPLPTTIAHDNKRRDIVNPDLCDEAIDILRATGSLPPPGTCELIDINPGTAVWSKALHRALQPRRHVLVELERSVYASSIDPLLNEEASSYRLSPSLLDALDQEQDLLSPQFRSFYKNLNPDDRDKLRRSPNKHLIFTANLASRRVHAGSFSGALSKFFLAVFSRQAAFDAGKGEVEFHKYGPVKLLAWVPEADKYSFLPRGISHRTKTSKSLQASCHLREIVSSFDNDGRNRIYRPWYGAVLESAQQVAQRQRKLPFEIPLHRQQPDPDPPSKAIPPTPDNFKKLLALRERPPLVAQYIRLTRKVSKQYPEWYNEYIEKKRIPDDTPRVKGSVPADEVYDRLRLSKLKDRAHTVHNHYTKVDQLLQQQISLERELIALRRLIPDNKTPYLQRLKEIQDSGEFARIKNEADSFFKDNRVLYYKARDDLRSLSTDPPALAWHNRTFEPLLCHPETDFYPSQPMTLLEITPKEEFLQRINTSTRWICFDFIVTELQHDTATVQTGLERLVGPAGSESYTHFLEQVPSLTDPLHGGYHDLADCNIRTLPTEMYIDIALAYEKLPYRKDELEMIASTLGNTGKNIGWGRYE